jgi:hypothetical protein
MWSVQVNGVWQNASTDQVRELVARGVIGPQTVVRHDTWAEPGRIGQVQAFAHLFPRVEALDDADIQVVEPAPPSEKHGTTAPGRGRAAGAAWNLSALAPFARPAGLAAGAVAGLTCIIAGLYLLSWTSQVAADKSGTLGDTAGLLSALKTGLGIYFCGNGLGVWATTLSRWEPGATPGRRP